MKFGVGQPVRRYEDVRLVTGQGRYTDDIVPDGLTHGFVLRSPVAHARIRRIDTEAAREVPGVLAVLTGDDVAAAGLGDVPCNVPLTSIDGSARHDTPRPLLARGKVRHVGEPVAFVVAETLAAAKDAVDLVEVDYEELSAVADVRAAVAEGAPRLFDHIDANLAFDWGNGDREATEEAFRRAAHVTTVDLVNNRVVANSMEPRNAIGEWDAEAERMILHTGTQGPHVVLGPMANAVFKVPPESIRIVTPNVGGGFGMKAFIYPEQCLVLWAAKRVGRPVKWQSERTEAFMSDYQGRDHRSLAELALDAEGHFLGVRVTTHANLGGYLSPLGPFVCTRASDLVAGLYTTPAIWINVKGCLTNTVPVDAYRGAGRPEAAYLIERLVDAAAREIGIGPDEIRRRNFIPPQAMPYTTALGVTYDSGEFTALMDTALEKADWAGFPARKAASVARGRLRGRGLAVYVERCGGGRDETAIVEFRDDDTIDLLIGNQEFGTGLVTAYRQVAAEYLGVGPERVNVIQGDTDRTPPGMTGGSRALPVGGAAIVEVSQKIAEKGRRIAAQVMETAPVDVEFAEGRFTVAGTDRSMTLFEVAKAARDPANLPKGVEPGLDDRHTRVPDAATYPNGCHVIEVEIDPATGELGIDRYTVVDDFGEVINPIMLAGQVHGGIVQGLGQALMEHTVYDETGQLLTGSFMDYTMPRADDVPFFEFHTRNVRCLANPLGVKGAGEAGAIGAPPAVINAIVDALHDDHGVTHVDMPATRERIWQAIHGRRAAA